MTYFSLPASIAEEGKEKLCGPYLFTGDQLLLPPPQADFLSFACNTILPLLARSSAPPAGGQLKDSQPFLSGPWQSESPCYVSLPPIFPCSLSLTLFSSLSAYTASSKYRLSFSSTPRQFASHTVGRWLECFLPPTYRRKRIVRRQRSGDVLKPFPSGSVRMLRCQFTRQAARGWEDRLAEKRESSSSSCTRMQLVGWFTSESN